MDIHDDELETPPSATVQVQASRILGPRVKTDRQGKSERLGSLKSAIPSVTSSWQNSEGHNSPHNKPVDQLESFAYRGLNAGVSDKGGRAKGSLPGISNGSRRSSLTEEGGLGSSMARHHVQINDADVPMGVRLQRGSNSSNKADNILRCGSQEQSVKIHSKAPTGGKMIGEDLKPPQAGASKRRRMIVSDSEEDEDVEELNGHGVGEKEVEQGPERNLGKKTVASSQQASSSVDRVKRAQGDVKIHSRNEAQTRMAGEGRGNGRKSEHGARDVEVIDIDDAEDVTVEEEEEEHEDRRSCEEEADPVLKVLRTCEGITAKLRRQLEAASCNGAAIESDRYAAVDESAATLVSQADVRAACGEGEVNLKGYQLVGVNFLLLLHRQGMGGAILADEMGLGKTIQAITFLALLAHLDKDRGPHLVVAPASLLENWQREIARWCPSLRTILYHGTERKHMLHDLTDDVRKGRKPRFDILLVCYSMFERDSAIQKDDRKLLRRFRFSCVLMDEAHLLKDRSTMRTKRLRDVAGAAKHRLMLTGTPLQNDLQELWSLLEFLMPAIFTTQGCDLTQFLGTREEGGRISGGGGNLISRIKRILGPFVLRRVKADVMKQLAAKEQKVEVIDMVEEQQAAYELAVDQYKRTMAEKRATGAGGEGKIAQLLPRKQLASIFTHLRKVANHPLLVRRLYDNASLRHLAKVLHRGGAFGDECSLQRVEEEIAEYSDFDLHQLCVTYAQTLGKHVLPTEVVLCSGKCRALSFLLPRLQREGHRPLLFSQWTAMLDVLQWLLDFLGMPWLRLDGSTAVVERQALVDEYNGSHKIFAFLLSTRAGGQGLNLTGADTVILHDVDFNPQVDRQAEDRCHRIGQTKPVTVYRMVSKGTVDESILKIAQRKLSLDAAVLDAGGDEKVVAESDSRTMGEILSSILDS